MNEHVDAREWLARRTESIAPQGVAARAACTHGPAQAVRRRLLIIVAMLDLVKERCHLSEHNTDVALVHIRVAAYIKIILGAALWVSTT